MTLIPVERTSFAAGQIDTPARHDNQKPLYLEGCSFATNMRILNGGGMKRRPGTWLRDTLVGWSKGVEFVDKNGNSFKLVFSNARLDVYDSTNTLVQTITGTRWSSNALVDQMYVDRYEGAALVTHNNFWPQAVTVDDSGTWSVSDFAFDAAFSGGPAQPYYRYAAKLVTLQPSGLTGSITLTTSASVFVNVGGGASHIGTYFRYLGCPVLITAVVSSTSATGTVQEALPQTVTFTVDNASNFAVDEQAEGLDSGAKGVITNISGTTFTFVYVSNFGGLKSGETLVGDSSKAQCKLTSNPSNTTPAAVVDWDEQAFSTVRGFPGCGATHRGRVYFTNMRDLPRGITASAAGLPNYFLVGANDGDAFFELLPDFKGQRGLYVIEAEQGLVLTDQAVYVLPEVNAPVTPSTITFNRAATIGAAAYMKPIPTEQGFAFVEAGANRVMGILPTGSISAPWEVKDISAFWSELLTGPASMGFNYQTAGFPERYGFVLNTDGTVAAVKYQDPQANVPLGWTVWKTANGAPHSLFTANGKLFAILNRSSPAAWTLEEFDDALYLDCCSAWNGSAMLPFYANTTIAVMNAGTAWYRGSYAVDGSGNVQGFTAGAGSYVVGYDLATRLTPTPAIPQRYGYPSPDFRFGMNFGLPRMYLHVVNTVAYTINGQVYGGSGPQGSAPALVTGVKRWKLPGRSNSLAPDITQQIPGPLEVVAMTLEVSY